MHARLAAALAAALAVTLVPAVAHATTRVDGTRFDAAGVRILSQGCQDPLRKPSLDPVRRVVHDPSAPLGAGAIGWTSRRSQYAVGPTVHINAPSSLTRLRISVARRGRTLSGQAVAVYSAPNDTGMWRGSAAVPGVEDTRQWQVVNADSVAYNWRHYTSAGVLTGYAGPATLPDFAVTEGGNGHGAWVGFIFGCNKDTFAVDALRVVAGKQHKTLDFEPPGARATLAPKTGSSRALTVVAGAKVKVVAGLQALSGKRLGGTVVLQRKAASAKKFQPVQKIRLRPGQKSSFGMKPVQSASYRLRYAGTSTYAPDTSPVLKVRVRANVRAHLASRSVTKGKPFAISGRFYPGRATKLRLERYVHGTWKTTRTLRSAKDGSYRVSMHAPQIGKSYWRIEVGAGGGNLSGHSPSMRLITRATSHSGGGTPTDPTPPPTDPTPPPPPTGPQ